MEAKSHAAHEDPHRRSTYRLETHNEVPTTCHPQGILPALRKQPAEKYLSRFFAARHLDQERSVGWCLGRDTELPPKPLNPLTRLRGESPNPSVPPHHLTCIYLTYKVFQNLGTRE